MVKKYLKHFKWKVLVENLEERINEMYEKATTTPDQIDTHEADAIFQDIREIMQESEDQCRRFHTGTIKFLAKSNRALAAVRYWQMLDKKNKEGE